MTQKELTELTIGENLDQLMNLDPRGYGVSRILYGAARKYTGEPLAVHAARLLCETVKEGDLVFILTGFVLLSHKKAEMDGIIGSMLLSRALALGLGAKPVIICPEESREAVRNLSRVAGLHLYEDLEEVKRTPISMGICVFTKDPEKACDQACQLLKNAMPAAVLAIECPGANSAGVYHNSVGQDVTELEAKSDVLFQKLKEAGVLNIAIGDLGNELGMAAISDHIKKYVPYAGSGACRCGCGGGIAAAVSADHIITATVSDWGCYGLIAAIAFRKGNPDIMHGSEMEEDAVKTASRSGMIDMYGWLIPAIDGFDLKINLLIVDLMRECIAYAPKLADKCRHWFDGVLSLGYYGTGGDGE